MHTFGGFHLPGDGISDSMYCTWQATTGRVAPDLGFGSSKEPRGGLSLADQETSNQYSRDHCSPTTQWNHCAGCPLQEMHYDAQPIH